MARFGCGTQVSRSETPTSLTGSARRDPSAPSGPALAARRPGSRAVRPARRPDRIARATPKGTGRDEHRSGRGGLPHHEGRQVALDVLHRVIDGEQAGDVTARGVDIEVDVLVGSSLSKWMSWAMTRFDTVSSMASRGTRCGP